jgi:hypothetical protein
MMLSRCTCSDDKYLQNESQQPFFFRTDLGLQMECFSQIRMTRQRSFMCFYVPSSVPTLPICDI